MREIGKATAEAKTGSDGEQVSRGMKASFTVAEIAKRLRVHPRTVRRTIDRGELRARNVAASSETRPLYRVDEDAFAEYLRARGEVVADYIAVRRAEREGTRGTRGTVGIAAAIDAATHEECATERSSKRPTAQGTGSSSRRATRPRRSA